MEEEAKSLFPPREEAQVVIDKRGRRHIRTPRSWRKPPDKAPVKSPERAERLRRQWADPKWRARMLEGMKTRRKPTRAESGVGIPRGMRRLQYKTFRKQARLEATLLMKKLDEAGVLDDADDQAREALHTAISVMRGPESAKDKLAAARLVLDFTKAKPAQKQDITLNKAEAWLEAVTKDNDDTRTGEQEA